MFFQSDSMKKLGKEYEITLQLITARINELKHEKNHLQDILRDGNSELQSQIDCLEGRIASLLAIQRDVREIGKEIIHYYERSWWRSEKYTVNARKSRIPVLSFTGLLEDEIINKLCPDSGDEENNS